MWHAWNLSREELATVLIHKCASKKKAHQVLASVPSPVDYVTMRDCLTYYEMLKMIERPGAPRTPNAAARILADRCPGHMRDNLFDRWRKGFAEYEATGGPLVWMRNLAEDFAENEPFQVKHLEYMRRRNENNERIGLVGIPYPLPPWDETYT